MSLSAMRRDSPSTKAKEMLTLPGYLGRQGGGIERGQKKKAVEEGTVALSVRDLWIWKTELGRLGSVGRVERSGVEWRASPLLSVSVEVDLGDAGPEAVNEALRKPLNVCAVVGHLL